MEKKMLLNENETIEINGAKLTPEVLKQIASFQEDENRYIEYIKASISDAICYMIQSVDGYSGTDKVPLTKAVLRNATDLTYYREILNSLKFDAV